MPPKEVKGHKLVLRQDRQESQEMRRQSNSTLINKQKKDLDLLSSLKRDLTSEQYECMICYDIIKRRQFTYSCSTCFACFHLKCINTWAQQNQGNWRCPGCQTVSTELPSVYYCFCMKQIQPDFNRMICPHSCGNNCGKDRKCDHKCNLPCHPGPCPPCELYATPISCACGKGLLKVTCRQILQIDFIPSCGQDCGKILNCGIHACTMGCHHAPCPPCPITSKQLCYCGKSEKGIPCGQVALSFSCENPCGFIYPCGHRCEQQCHGDEHDTVCPKDPSKFDTCPCGRSSISELTFGIGRQSCFEAIPVCNKICLKLQDCGHHCQSLCHLGECPPCEALIESACRCGLSARLEVPCHLVQADADGAKRPVCTRVCTTKLSCGRHRCDQVCCTLEKCEHVCDRTCGKNLSCTKHKCLMPCGHQGNCHDCLEGVSFDELTCACGRTVMYPPIPCNTRPPKCNYTCRKPKPCGHPSYTAHYCHPEDEPCPPCTIFTERLCACGAKRVKNIPCSRQSKPSCGAMCKKTIIECGHPCGRVCHDGTCLDGTHPCSKRCGSKRSCGHICQYPCHGIVGCDEQKVCKQSISVSCECGFRKIKRQCGMSKDIVPEPLSLECNDLCLRNQRALKMAEALKIGSDGISKVTGGFIGWEERVVKLGLSYPNIVLATEKKLKELVNEPHILYHYFPEQRVPRINSLIAELASNYGFLTEIVDERFGKPNVIVRRQNTRVPTLPPKLLSEVCKGYNPKDTANTDKYIIKSEEPDSKKTSVNGIYFSGIPLTVQVVDIWNKIKDILIPLVENASLFWMDDDQCFIYYRAKESLLVPDSQQPSDQSEPIEDEIMIVPEVKNESVDTFELVDRDTLESLELNLCLTLAEKCKIALEDIVSSVVDISVSPVGGIHFGDGKISHYKRRNTDSFRIGDKEWKKATGSWKDEGIVLV